MNTLSLWIMLSLVFSILFWKFSIPTVKEKTVTIGNATVPLFFILAFTLRIVLSTQYVGFGTDVACFSAWADRMVELGPSKFYAKDYFSDYPPLYLYALYLIGFIKKTFQITSYSTAHLILLKLPAILSDLGIGYVIYKIGTKRLGLSRGICLSALYLFQPVVLMNSCLWCQVDSVYTLFLIIAFVFLENKNLLPAMLVFGIGVLLKPQVLVFAPVLLLGVIHYVFRGNFSFLLLIRAIGYGLLTGIVMFFLAAPFGMENVLSQYFDTLSSYPYASVNAYNFWAGIGLNWYPQETLFCGMPCSSWGTIAIILAAAFALILGLRLGNLNEKYFVVASFLILTVFTFSVRMHERYLYPLIPFLLLGFTGFASRQALAVSSKAAQKDKLESLSPALRFGYPAASIVLTWLHFCNTSHVLFYYDPAKYDQNNPVIRFVGIGMIIAALFYYFIILRLQSKKELAYVRETTNIRKKETALVIKEESTHMTRMDYVLMLVITIVYSCFAFHDLGDRVAPQTVYHFELREPVSFRFPEGKRAASLYYYVAPAERQNFLIGCKNADQPSEVTAKSIQFESVFCWQEKELPQVCDEVILTAQQEDCNVIELVFLDEDGNPLVPVNASDHAELFDEQDLFPESPSFRNSTYFDEIYHARTAYEFLHGLRCYENTHPPLGKIFISIGVSLFGMVPFGWRIIGTLFGIAMLPVTYFFAKKLTGDTPAAAFTCFLFAFDFMHFAQTRIATIDVYVVFFILCMYYFMYRFLCMDVSVTPLKKLLVPLFFCGLAMGLGVASKWTGVYAGLGLAVLFFGHVSEVLMQSTSDDPRIKKWTLKNALTSSLGKKVFKIMGYCVIFFVVIPLIIYVLSYIPFKDGTDNGLIKRAITNQQTMFNYHSQLVATHPYSSPFYEWPFMKQPIWYYSGIISSTLREGISSFGNPLVWWAGIPALVYMFYLFVTKKDRRALFLIIGYFSQYLPWFLVSRLTFIYHYFPCVVFLALMLGYAFRNLKASLPKKAYLAILIVYALLVFGLFLAYYPILSGQTVEISYVTKYLKWFKSWHFIWEGAVN